MRRKDYWIAALFVIALAGFFYMEGEVKPSRALDAARYEQAQQDPLTHNIHAALQQRGQYMGSVSTLTRLNQELPYRDLEYTYQLYPEKLTAQLHFKRPSDEVEQGFFRRMIMYNATANLGLVDNMEAMDFHFPDAVYSVQRSQLMSWYGLHSHAELTQIEVWKAVVQEQVRRPDRVDAFYEQVVEISVP
ncbi:DUF4825 domain-containing protein [Paenibacillus sp. JSM ZJ436]|uniref:DUF4825 domain-containing protein n=1 Tax=Paenibacillus sp. JSM ZJ436 TaxID=3376190 RepID=UPI0037A58EF2